MARHTPSNLRNVRLGAALLALAAAGLLQPACGDSLDGSSPTKDAGSEAGDSDAADADEASDGDGSADGAHDGAGVADAPDGPIPCPVRQAMWEFIYANKSCTTASDCTVAKTCFTEAEGCGNVLAGIYLNASYDPSKLAEREAALSKSGDACCYIPGCDYVEPAVCWKQTCLPFHGDDTQANRDKCHGLLGRNTLCAACACSKHGPICLQDPACFQLLQCAHDNACLGTPKCAPDNPASPCKGLVDAMGGSSAKAVTYFGAVNELVPFEGCDIPCANP